MPWKIVHSSTPFKSPWLQVQKDTCLVRNGKKLDYYSFRVHDWGIVVAFTPSGQMVLIRQYRHPIRKTVLELPGGNIEKGEKPARSIRREFEEETGFRLKKIKKLGTWFPMHGRSSTKVLAFVGETNALPAKSNCEPAEEIKVVLKEPKEVLKLVRSSQMLEAPHLAAVLMAKEKYPEKFR